VKIAILGASGIIGQHMRLIQPPEVEAVYTRLTRFTIVRSGKSAGRTLDLTDSAALRTFLSEEGPDAIVNLAGENRPDEVERFPGHYRDVNVEAPALLSYWSELHKSHLVQVSTQAVFGGWASEAVRKIPGAIEFWGPPYGPESPRCPVNQYGLQKLQAEQEVASQGQRWTIVRPTFVLGVRPVPAIGRQNPVEQMLAPVETIAVESEAPATQRQVCDRWFSVSFAWDVARKLWEVAMGERQRKAIHVGIPYRTNRHIIASYLRPDITIEPVSHDDFPGLAPRPLDTTYAGKGSWSEIADGLERCRQDYLERHLRVVLKQGS
jgi:dTDP-4-dehydrorhamnose reductase